MRKGLPLRSWLLGLIVAAILPITLFASIVAEQLSTAQRNATMEQVRQRTEALNIAVERQMQASFAALTALAESNEAQHDDLAGLYAHAQRLLARQSIGTSIALSDRQGHILFVTRRRFGEKLADVGADDVAPEVFTTGKPQVSDLLWGTVTRDPLTIMHVPIMRAGSVVYDLRLGVRPATLIEILAEQKLPPEWSTVIVDRKGNIIARSRSPQFLGQSAAPPLLEALSHADSGFVDVVTKDGQPVKAAFQRVPLSGWAVAIGVPHAVLEAPGRRLRTIVALGGAGSLAIGAMVALIMARRFCHQMGEALDAAAALGRGQEPAPVRTGVRELAELGAALTEAHVLLRRRGQEMLEAKHEAERANLSKSKFLASASHDMRQPVQSMMMFTSVLEQQLAGQPAATVVRHLERAAMSLKSLLDGLLDVSRIDAGIIVPAVADAPAGPLLEELASEYRLKARDKGLELKVVPTSVWLRTDPALLERILRNLIENAIKYTASGRVLVGCRRRGESAAIVIADTGVGIPKDQQAAIFEEFYQLHNPERDRSQGLGLGLSIVQRLSRLLGHPIEVHSQPGRGSCFFVTVPLGAAGHRMEPSAVRSASRPPSPSLAVVIDDEEEVRAGLQLQLQEWGYEVVTGADHHAVLPLLDGRHPDVVVADYRLRGELNGITALRELERTLGSVRGFLLTGDTSPQRIAEAKRSGFELLHKPLSAASLRDHLSQPAARPAGE
ncbi:MAG: ATP-binding protein [Solirubrobacterales bacterium]